MTSGLVKQVGKGLGGGMGKRHCKPPCLGVLDVTKAAIQRLARRGGIERISGLCYDCEARLSELNLFLHSVVHDTVLYAQQASRTAVQPMDVLHGLKTNGYNFYG